MPLVQVPSRLKDAEKVLKAWRDNATINFGTRNSTKSTVKRKFHVKRRRRGRKKRHRKAQD